MLRLIPSAPVRARPVAPVPGTPDTALSPQPRCMPYPLAEEYLAMGAVFGGALSTGPNGFEALSDWLEGRA